MRINVPKFFGGSKERVVPDLQSRAEANPSGEDSDAGIVRTLAGMGSEENIKKLIGQQFKDPERADEVWKKVDLLRRPVKVETEGVDQSLS